MVLRALVIGYFYWVGNLCVPQGSNLLSTEIMIQIRNFNRNRLLDAITHPGGYVNGGLAKLSMKLGRE